MKRLYLANVFLAITQIVMPQVPVVLVAGQSNTDGRVDNAELPEYSQKPKRWAYDAVVYYELERLWQRPFYVIKESLGGTAIDPRCESSSNMHWSAGLLGKRMYEKVKDVLSVTYSNDRTPIMGWSSWNTYNRTQKKIEA